MIDSLDDPYRHLNVDRQKISLIGLDEKNTNSQDEVFHLATTQNHYQMMHDQKKKISKSILKQSK